MKHEFVLVPEGVMFNDVLEPIDKLFFIHMTGYLDINGFVVAEKEELSVYMENSDQECEDSIVRLVSEGFLLRITESGKESKLKFNYPENVLKDMYIDLTGNEVS